MRVMPVLRKDIGDAIRSKALWFLSFFMVGLSVLGLYGATTFAEADASQALSAFNDPILLIIPILALVISYKSIVAERETGSLRMLLSLPILRWEVVAGKFLGRTAVLALPILVAFAVSVPLSWYWFGDIAGVDTLQAATLSIALALPYIAIGMGLSASVRNSTQAVIIAILVYIITAEAVWSLVPTAGYLVLFQELPDPGANWYLFYESLSPKTAAETTVDLLYGSGISDVPLYLQEWLAIPLFILWVSVPLLLGYVAFDNSDVS